MQTNLKIFKYITLIITCMFPFGYVYASQSMDATIQKMEVKAKKNVEISWESLYFTYNMTYSYGWDEETHKYKENVNGVWNGNGKLISVTNYSIVPITASFDYFKLNEADINATFSNNNLYLKKGQKESVKMYLNGVPKNKTSNYNKIGVVTVTVT